MNISYSLWDTDPALLAHYDDGRIYGFIHRDGAWRQADDADIIVKARSLSKNDFDKMFPAIGLPDFPA